MMYPTRWLFGIVFFLLSSVAVDARQVGGRIEVAEASATSLVETLAAVKARRTVGDRAPLVIVLPAGEYRLEQTLQIDASTVGEGLAIRCEDEGVSIVTGARKLSFVEQDSEGRFRYDLAELPESVQRPPRAVLVDGLITTAARHPNRGFMRVDTVAEDRRSGFTVREHDWEGLKNVSPKDGVLDLVFLHDWSTSRLPIQSIDANTRMLTTLGPIGCSAPHYAINHFEAHPRYWLEGHPSFADLPGEWYIDPERSHLVLVPLTQDGGPPAVEVPMLETLVEVVGEESTPVTNLEFYRIAFKGAKYPFPAGGMATAQATMHEPRDASGNRSTSDRPMLAAAVHFAGAKDCRLEHCSFVQTGGTGLWIGERTQRCEVVDCSFSHTGGNAVNFGEDNSRRVDGRVWYQSVPQQVPTENRLISSRIEAPGVVMPGAVGVWAALNAGLEIADNEIVETPYTGISLGWIWNDSPSPARDNHIHDNRIKHVMRVLSDGGAIYTLGRQPGSVIENNLIEGVPNAAGRAESNGMFLDEGTTEFTIRNNVIKRVAQSPLRFHKAGQNDVVGNHWELRFDNTPPVRYNNTPEANIRLVDNEVIDQPRRIYLIGNSLTWDTRPDLLTGEVNWHVDCGKSLPHIDQFPLAPCVSSSTIWPDALRRGPWDTIVIQPFYGSTLDADVAVIDEWMKMEPTAKIVLHTGWARAADVVSEYEGSLSEDLKMTHHPAYFERLIEEIKRRHPNREITRTQAMDVLYEIAVDIREGASPLKSIEDLYRDAIHMTNEQGRPLMHEIMKSAVGYEIEPLEGEGDIIGYLNQKLESRFNPR